MAFNFRLRAVLYFSPTIVRSFLAIFSLPLMTAYLSVEDYGFFALIVAVGNFFAVFPAIGSSVIIAKYFAPGDKVQRDAVITNVLFLSFVIGLLFCFIGYLSWLYLLTHFPSYEHRIPHYLIALSVTNIVFSGWIAFSSEVTTLENRSGTFAFINIFRDTTATISSILALYIWQMQVEALFVGYALAGALGGVLGLWSMKSYLLGNVQWSWIVRIFEETRLIFAQLFEQGATLLERSIVAGGLGIAQLGILNHSKMYESILLSMNTALSRTVWSQILEEVRTADQQNERSWFATQSIMLLGLMSGIFFCTVGYDVVGLLTHQKFNEAAYLAAFWSVFVSFRSTSFIPKAYLYTEGNTKVLSNVMFLGYGLYIVLLYILVDYIGIYAVLVSYMSMILMQKAVYFIPVIKRDKFVFQEYTIFISLILVILFYTISIWFADEFLDRLTFFIAFSVLSYLVLYRVVNRVFSKVFNL